MNTSRAKVLVVDDSPLDRTLLGTCLQEAGYAVLEAEGGEQALELLRTVAIDVILLDLVMPDPDGFEVLRRLRADNSPRPLPVIAVSAAEDMESVSRCLKLGALDHLSKPFDPVVLHARMRSALATKRLAEEQEQRRLSMRMFRHLQRLSMGFYSRVPAGQITARSTTDLAAVDITNSPRRTLRVAKTP